MNQIKIPPTALHAATETQKFFEQPIEAEAQEIMIAPEERTPEGFIELAWEHLDLQKALHLDWRHQEGLQGDVSEWPENERKKAEAKIAEFNKTRDEPLDINAVDKHFLLRLVEPNWVDELAPEKIEEYPEHMRINLEGLHEVDAKLRVLSQDEGLRAAAQETKAEHTQVMKAAIGWIKSEDKIAELAQKITDTRLRNGRASRPLTKAEQTHITGLEARMMQLQVDKGREINSNEPEYISSVANEIERRDRKKAHQQYNEGLVMTDSMQRVIEEALPSLVKGSPVLFVGETGGAKTALAEYISRKYIGKEPELVSGYADVNGYQLMGKTGLNTKQGATVSEFVAGPVVRAMQEGRPLILDEVNAMPPEFLKRLNKIMQLRPGDLFSVQEDSGLEVTVKPGFAIMATANEKSKRYKGVHDLSVEFMNRFNADTYRIRYPDHDVVVGQMPVENLRIAYGAICDTIGEPQISALSEEKLETFVKAAHLTQRLYAGHISEGLEQSVTDAMGTDRLTDPDATGLEETVLAPRTMAAILTKLKDSNGSLSLERVLGTWLDGIKNPYDRRIVETVLSSHRLLKQDNNGA